MEILKKYFEKAKANPKIVIIIGLLGIALIFLSSIFGSSGNGESIKAETKSISAEEYSDTIEAKLGEQISEVTGGKVNVMVTLNTGIEYIYASEAKSNISELSDEDKSDKQKSQIDKESENNYILYKDENGNEVPLVVTEVMPTVKGVVVGCENGQNEAIAAAVTDLVTTALDISEDKVCVVGLDIG